MASTRSAILIQQKCCQALRLWLSAYMLHSGDVWKCGVVISGGRWLHMLKRAGKATCAQEKRPRKCRKIDMYLKRWPWRVRSVRTRAQIYLRSRPSSPCRANGEPQCKTICGNELKRYVCQEKWRCRNLSEPGAFVKANIAKRKIQFITTIL